MAQAQAQPEKESEITPFDLMEKTSVLGAASKENMRELTAEITQFISKRLEKDVEAQKSLFECKNPADACEFVTEFMQESCTEYFDEVNRLGKIILETNRKNLEKFSSRFMDEKPKKADAKKHNA